MTAFSPGTPLPSETDTAYSLFGSGFVSAGDPVGTAAVVRFVATSGTPFAFGTSATWEASGVVVSNNQIVGVVPAPQIPSDTPGPVACTVELSLPLAGSTFSTTPLALFAPLLPKLLAYEPSTPVPGTVSRPFVVEGSGFAPVGGAAHVTFTALSGSFCGMGSNVTLDAQVTSTSTIEGLTPAGGVAGETVALVSVDISGGPSLVGLVVARITSGGGTGTFVDTLAGLSGDHVTNVAIGDLDGDGHLDLLSANGGGGTATNVSVFLNDGAGHLVAHGAFSNDNAAHRVAMGDVDGDGHPDAVVVYYASGSPNVWRNDGTGAFTAFGPSLGSMPSLCVTLADLTGDGHPEILVGVDTGGTNRVFVNDGTGHFSPGAAFATGSATWAIATADVDGDGDLDVFASNGGTVTLFLNDGAGVLTPSPATFASSGLVQALAAGDLDGDGDVDLVVVHRSGGTRIYLNQGSGAFVGTGQTLGDTTGLVTSAFGVALGDVDGDCDLDLVIGNAPGFDIMGGVDGRTTVWRNDGHGTFSDSGQRLGPSFGLRTAVALGDLDSDGDLDLVTGEGGGFALNVYSNP